MDKLCATCGRQLQPNEVFCEECGTARAESSAPAPEPARPSPPTPAASAPQAAKGGPSKPLFISLFVILTLVVLGGGGWLLASRPNAPQLKAAVPPPPAKNQASAATSTTRPAASPSDPSNAVAALITPATDTAAAASKPCSLVSRTEMEQILGMKVVNITSTEAGCSYFTDATMSVDIDSTWTGGREAMAAARGYNANPGLFEPVPGIGDEAFMQAAGVLHVREGDVYLTINARQYPNEAESENAMARKAVEKLK